MSAQITPPEKNSIEDVFWLIAIHYQILQVLKPDPKRSVEVSNEAVVTTNPNRSVPVKVKKRTYTLDDLLAKIPEDIAQCEDLEAELVNRNCNTDPSPTRSIPEGQDGVGFKKRLFSCPRNLRNLVIQNALCEQF